MADCTGTTKKGTPCRAAPLKGTDRCLAHSDADTRASVGFTPEAGKQGGRPRKPRADDILRERIEADIDRWLAPLEAALGAGKPVVTWDQAEGRHTIEYVVDPALGMKALKLALDRAYGKARQPIEHEGGDPDRPVRISAELLTDPELRDGLRDLKRRLADSRSGGPGGPGARGESAPRRRRDTD